VASPESLVPSAGLRSLCDGGRDGETKIPHFVRDDKIIVRDDIAKSIWVQWKVGLTQKRLIL